MLASHANEESDQHVLSRIMDRLGPRPSDPESQQNEDCESIGVVDAVDGDETVYSETVLASDSNGGNRSSSHERLHGQSISPQSNRKRASMTDYELDLSASRSAMRAMRANSDADAVRGSIVLGIRSQR